MTAPGPPTVAPCAWNLNTSAVPGWADGTPDQQATAEAVAVYVVWALSGRRFGTCQVVVRPEPPIPQVCRPYGLWPLDLPGPVASVDKVTVDGVDLDPAEYRVLGDAVYRDEPWPVLQDLALDDTEPGTWSVTYRRGRPVPVAGQFAAGVLAGEVLRSIRGVGGARIPLRAQSIAREGVSIQMLDPQAFLDGGKTGIPEVDMFLAASNPHRLSSAPRVWSPDLQAGEPVELWPWEQRVVP
jgi:hypothetical protein